MTTGPVQDCGSRSLRLRWNLRQSLWLANLKCWMKKKIEEKKVNWKFTKFIFSKIFWIRWINQSKLFNSQMDTNPLMLIHYSRRDCWRSLDRWNLSSSESVEWWNQELNVFRLHDPQAKLTREEESWASRPTALVLTLQSEMRVLAVTASGPSSVNYAQLFQIFGSPSFRTEKWSNVNFWFHDERELLSVNS